MDNKRTVDPIDHPWNVTPKEAAAIQEQLSQAVIVEDDLGPVRTVAGVDIGFAENYTITRAAVAVLTFPDLQLCDQAIIHRPTTFPYVPGLLSFREAPAALEALSKLSVQPDLLLCDGQGRAHPRRFGLACHLGLLCDIPSIGVAKSRLVGEHEGVGEERGSRQPLLHDGEVIGMVLRTRTNVKPLYISVGHRVSLTTAVDYVLRCTPKYRLPETTRQAHKMASGR
jgi:deoxyribonuclease V